MNGAVAIARALLAFLARALLWLLAGPDRGLSIRLKRHGFERLIRRLGITPEYRGTVCEGSTLFIANHISWADIPALGARIDGLFVARSDLAGWPVIGFLARRAGTLFVARESPGSSRTQVDSLTARLAGGRGLIVFAEGTTSVGETVLPFKTALFGAAQAAGRVQPVLIAYLDGTGKLLSAADRRRIAWIDDDKLFEGIARVARSTWRAHIEFLPPLDPAAYPDRKQLATATRQAIIEAQAALAKRVE